MHLAEEGVEQHRPVLLQRARSVDNVSSAEVGIGLVLNGEPNSRSPVLEARLLSVRARTYSVLEMPISLCYHVLSVRFDCRQRAAGFRRLGPAEAL